MMGNSLGLRLIERVCECLSTYISKYVCVCVCVRERERESESVCVCICMLNLN